MKNVLDQEQSLVQNRRCYLSFPIRKTIIYVTFHSWRLNNTPEGKSCFHGLLVCSPSLIPLSLLSWGRKWSFKPEVLHSSGGLPESQVSGAMCICQRACKMQEFLPWQTTSSISALAQAEILSSAFTLL